MKAQGTELYTIDPDDDGLIVVGCIREITGIDTTIEQVEVTCLQDLVRKYEAGLATPGAASFGIYTDPADASHVRLHQLKILGTELHWAVGWSDGTGVPPDVATNGEFDLPDNRSWITFDGFMNSFPFEFAQNSPVQSAIGVQVSGEPNWIVKTAT